jgi:hypothetical protein
LKLISSRTRAAAIAAALVAVFSAPPAHAQAPDSLLLQAPAGVKAWSVYNPGNKRFLVWITWKDVPNNVATFVSPADTTGWSLNTPAAALSYPTVSGTYTGDIDRTIAFHSTRAGVVGTDSLIISYEVRREEHVSDGLPWGRATYRGHPFR